MVDKSFKTNFVLDECGNPYIQVPLDRYDELVDAKTKLDAIERLHLSGEYPTLVEILTIIDSWECKKKIQEIKEQEEEQKREWSKDNADSDADL